MLLKLFIVALSLTPSFARAASLIPWSEEVLSHIKSENFTNQNCASYLANIESALDAINPNSPQAGNLKADAGVLIQNLWLARLALHDRLQTASPACAKEMRSAFRQLRFAEDFLGELKAQVENLDPATVDFQAQAVPTREDKPYYLMQTKNGQALQLQEGDLMIARGNSFLSATIARLGDIDSQFSHVILVVRDPETNLLETVESYVGEGVNFHEMNWALKNSNSRLLVLRAKNQAVAKRAAEDIWALVKARQGANKIYYDYALDFNNHDTMSCAEVAQFAFSKAGDELNTPFNLPERPSTLTHGLDLLKRLGVKPGSTFTPGDLEYDSRFEMIAEFHDLRLTLDSRLRDAIMTKALAWMDNENAVLHPSFKSKLAQGLIFKLRRTRLWPAVRKLLKTPDFSEEIPRNMLGTMALITQMGDGMLKELKSRDQLQFIETGFHFTYLELYKELDSMKLIDKQKFENRKTRKRSIILKFLRPQ